MAVWMNSDTYSMIYRQGRVVQHIKTRQYLYLEPDTGQSGQRRKPGLHVIQVHDGMPPNTIADYPTPQIVQEMQRIANTTGVMI